MCVRCVRNKFFSPIFGYTSSGLIQNCMSRSRSHIHSPCPKCEPVNRKVYLFSLKMEVEISPKSR